jgi:hypothetical protein
MLKWIIIAVLAFTLWVWHSNERKEQLVREAAAAKQKQTAAATPSPPALSNPVTDGNAVLFYGMPVQVFDDGSMLVKCAEVQLFSETLPAGDYWLTGNRDFDMELQKPTYFIASLGGSVTRAGWPVRKLIHRRTFNQGKPTTPQEERGSWMWQPGRTRLEGGAYSHRY